MQPSDYTVGWICALPLELTAATAMLDESHPQLEQVLQDENTYSFGRIGIHNVVIAVLPAGEIGNNPASAVGLHMRYSFPELRFALLVGIGGGVPSAGEDIRLGDVVVSGSRGKSGGVVQYDLGKQLPGGTFEHRGTLKPPPRSLGTALATIQSKSLVTDNVLTDFVPHDRKFQHFTRESAGEDVLFQSSYPHMFGRRTCSDCDKSFQVNRSPRDSSFPKIHYGIIASGNSVIKDAGRRDALSKDLGGVKCFEMEAAGLVDIFPCLVIRGISDYADSHKNDKWQYYASMSAAAFAKELLGVVPGNYVKETPSLEATFSRASDITLPRTEQRDYQRETPPIEATSSRATDSGKPRTGARDYQNTRYGRASYQTQRNPGRVNNDGDRLPSQVTRASFRDDVDTPRSRVTLGSGYDEIRWLGTAASFTGRVLTAAIAGGAGGIAARWGSEKSPGETPVPDQPKEKPTRETQVRDNDKWVTDIFPAYRLTESVLRNFLVELFGPYDFWIKVRYYENVVVGR